MALKEDFKDIALHWKKTQLELSQAVSSLCEVSAQLAPEDSNANPLLHNTTATATSNNNNTRLATAVDFLSIFAENDLVSDNLGSVEYDSWNRTLPANFQRRRINAERPRTLTPPPQQSNGKQRFRKRDWKFYAYGKYKSLIPVQKKHEYAFSPVKPVSDNINVGGQQVVLEVLKKPIKPKQESLILDKIQALQAVKCDNAQSVCERKISTLDINVNCTDSSATSTSSSSNGTTSEEQGHLASKLSVKSNLLKTGDNLLKNKDKGPLWSNKCSLECVDSSLRQPTTEKASNIPWLPCNAVQSGSVHNESQGDKINMDVVSGHKVGDPACQSGHSRGSHGRDMLPTDQVLKLPKETKHHNSFFYFKEPCLTSPKLIKSGSSLGDNDENPVEHEGTMTYYCRESSSTSDAYYRESSLSPSTPDYQAKPAILLPPPPALDKHEARLKDSSRISNASSRTKSNERKSKKKSKFKDKRDISPSKTERQKEGKVSTATQTQRPSRAHKSTTRSEDQKQKGDLDCNKASNGAESVTAHNGTHHPCFRKNNVESSTSSDESGEYKKVNITALRERFVKNRNNKCHKTNSPQHSKGNHDENNATVSSDAKITDINAFPNDHVSLPQQANHTADITDSAINNDILENDLYEENEAVAASTGGSYNIEDYGCSAVECHDCVVSAAHHCQYPHQPPLPHTDSCLQPNGAGLQCHQWSAIKHATAVDEGQVAYGSYDYRHEYQAGVDVSVGTAAVNNICESCREQCEDISVNCQAEDCVVIPSREQRRLCALPLMPVIEEDAHKSEESDTEYVCNVNHTDTSLKARSVKVDAMDSNIHYTSVDHKHNGMTVVSSVSQSSHVVAPLSPGAQSIVSVQSVSSSQSVYSQSSETSSSVGADTPTHNHTQAVSLLDRLHKKYYPAQYRDKAKPSTEVLAQQTKAKESGDLDSQKTAVAILSPNVDSVRSKTQGSSLAFGIASPRLKRLSPRQPEEGEESKPPPSIPSPTKDSPSHVTSTEEQIQNLKKVANKEENQEIEALEACKWLRAAGFPQYAQMYEDQQFPIDITSVEKDHDFLDPDSIQSIFRRLNTLNKCAGMKIDAPLHKTLDESDEEDQCALSDKWRYQRSSRRWSRKDLDITDLLVVVNPGDKQPVKSTSSQDSLLTDNDETTSQTQNSLVSSKKIGARENIPDRVHVRITDVTPEESAPAVNLFDNLDRSRTFKPIPVTGNGFYSREGSASPNLRRVQSEKVHSAKSFFKRIESFKTRKSTKKVKLPPGMKLEIGEPIVVNTDDMKERMERLGCKDISPKSLVSDMSGGTQELTNDLNTSYTIVSDTDLSPAISSTGDNTSEVAFRRKTHSTNTSSDDSSHKSSTISIATTKSSPVGQTSTKPLEALSVQPDLNSSDLDQVVFSLEHPEPSPTFARFPKVIPNGFIEMEDSCQLNYRTGSFNLGSHSEAYRQNLQARSARAASEEPERDAQHHRAGNALLNHAEYRMSVYDNLGPDLDPQDELDKILKDLLENIDGLNQSLGDSESLLELGTFGLSSNVPVTSSAELNKDNDQQHTITEQCSNNPDGVSELVGGEHEVVGHSSGSEVPLSVDTPCEGSGWKAQGSGTVERTCESLSLQSSLAADPSAGIQEGSPPGGDCSRKAEAVDSQDDSEGMLAGCAMDDIPSSSSGGVNDHNIPSTSQHQDGLPPLAPGLDLEFDLDPEEDDDEEEEEVRSHSSSGSSCSQHDSDGGETTAGSREEESSDQKEGGRERRDSGVGSSLTRAPSDRRRHRIRWHSFIKSHRPSLNSENLQISHMSAGQLMVLRKLCLLKVTGLMEKYSPTNRSGWNWAMPKFIKRFKAPDYKDKNVFGVPPLVILHRTGQPLPQCMLYAMRCLRRTAKDAVGIFRKSGVRSRIQKLRDDIEANPDSIDFESLQPYDVADLIKQYFRELPECLLTNKLSETFISVFTHVPSGERLEALQCTVMLLPDENREVLQSLLLFLSDMASHSHHNQMTASNLAVCFAPSLFHMFGQRNTPVGSPKPRGRKATGIPDQKELLEQKAAHECLTCMIAQCKKLFMVPEELLSKCRFSYIEQGDPVPLEELSKKRSADDGSTNGITAYIESCIQGLLKESREKFKGWVSVACPSSVELCYKKVGDGHPLRLWKCAVDVEAPPEEVLNRLLRERHLWDVDLMKWRVVEKLDQQTEVFQYILNSMAPHPSRDFCALRSWRTDLPKGACVLVSTSVEHGEGGLLGDIRAVILASRFLIEPCGAGKSRLTHICRIDIRGHTPEWYNKAHGHVCATYVARLRDSFKQTLSKTDGPETKI